MFGSRLRWLAAGGLLGVVIAGGVFLTLRKLSAPSEQIRQTLSPPSVVKEIQQLNSLISVKYILQKAIGFEEAKVPFGSEKILLFIQAEVLAGVELDKLAANQVTLNGGKLTIALPPPKILHIVVDDNETRVWDRRVTWWTPWVPANPDLERRARLAGKNAIEQTAVQMGILDRAKQNAQASIRGLLRALGAESVEFVSGT